MSLLIVTLDNTVLNVALPTLVGKLDASSSDLQWIVDAYVLVFAGLLLVSGSLADRVGRKRTFLAGLLAFAASSTWATYSDSVGSLIAARASMGIGAALIMPATLAIIMLAGTAIALVILPGKPPAQRRHRTPGTRTPDTRTPDTRTSDTVDTGSTAAVPPRAEQSTGHHDHGRAAGRR